tara:strand:+ start:219856 stop:220311 length:456 start_codon:yes stop_codon:yes gene_type:complete
MENNDVLRRLRFIIDANDQKMLEIFGNVNFKPSQEEVVSWLKKEDHADYVECPDNVLANFLNGLIIDKRGKKDDVLPKAENKLNNNIILRKLTIAFSIKTDDVVGVLDLAELKVGKSEISAFFRKPGHSKYRECRDQFLRNFLLGLQKKLK